MIPHPFREFFLDTFYLVVMTAGVYTVIFGTIDFVRMMLHR